MTDEVDIGVMWSAEAVLAKQYNNNIEDCSGFEKTIEEKDVFFIYLTKCNIFRYDYHYEGIIGGKIRNEKENYLPSSRSLYAGFCSFYGKL